MLGPAGSHLQLSVPLVETKSLTHSQRTMTTFPLPCGSQIPSLGLHCPKIPATRHPYLQGITYYTNIYTEDLVKRESVSAPKSSWQTVEAVNLLLTQNCIGNLHAGSVPLSQLQHELIHALGST